MSTTGMTLVKLAAVGGMIYVSSILGIRYLVIKRFQQTEYYQKSVRVVLENKRLVELLGEPVHFGNPEFGDNKANYSTPHEAKFIVPIKGTKKRGKLHLYATREAEFKVITSDDHGTFLEKTTDSDSASSNNVNWELCKLELSLDDKPESKLDLVSLALASQKSMPM